MLNTLLKVLDEGRAFSLQEAAERLCTDTETVTALIQYLEQLGLLRQVEVNVACDEDGKGCTAGCHHVGGKAPERWEKVSV